MEENSDAEQLTLTLFLIYEYQKGADSFWKPYLDLMPDVKFFCHWPDNVLMATQDVSLIRNAIMYQ